jgi:hydrogenase-4 component F
MLAYSSIEHMGILAVGVGLAGSGTWGSLFHALNHSLVKGALFLISGNILAAYGTKKTSGVRGALGTVPVSGALWVIGLFAITGAPPFGTFASELAILKAAMNGSYAIAGVYLAALVAAFIGMAGAFLAMAQGRRGEAGSPAGPAAAAEGAPAPAALDGAASGHGGSRAPRERVLMVAAPLALLAAAAVLGVFIPGFLDRLLREAAALMGA